MRGGDSPGGSLLILVGLSLRQFVAQKSRAAPTGRERKRDQEGQADYFFRSHLAVPLSGFVSSLFTESPLEIWLSPCPTALDAGDKEVDGIDWGRLSSKTSHNPLRHLVLVRRDDGEGSGRADDFYIVQAAQLRCESSD